MFVVEGRFLTDHARDRLRDYSWEDALRFLSENLEGINYNQVVSILQGRMQLTGDSRTGVGLKEEDEKNKQETIAVHRWLFSGIWYDRLTNRNWMPYAIASGWCTEDTIPEKIPNRYHAFGGRAVPTSIEEGGAAMRRFGEARCVAYMDDKIEDRVVVAAVPGMGQQCVLWKETRRTVPPWWQLLTTPQLAVVEWVHFRGPLPVRGVDWLKGDTYRLRTESKREEPLVEAREQPEFTAEVIKQFVPTIEDQVADGLARALSGRELPEVNPTKDLSAAKWAWISPDGKVWPCRGYMDHIPTAYALVEKLGLHDSTLKDNPERLLELRNWTKVGHNNTGETYAYRGRRTTKRQTEIVVEWLMTHAADPDQIKRFVENGDGFDY